MKFEKDAAAHYDALIDAGDDPVHDSELLREYMDKWDGETFLSELRLSKEKNVLEIGVGTGRLARKTAPLCGSFTGIDISPKTIARAAENLVGIPNVSLICDDFITWHFNGLFDVIYSSLTFMHIEDKLTAMNKAAGLLAPGGRFVLSIDKNRDSFIDMGDYIVKTYPDDPDEICGFAKAARMKLAGQLETEFAYILTIER